MRYLFLASMIIVSFAAKADDELFLRLSDAKAQVCSNYVLFDICNSQIVHAFVDEKNQLLSPPLTFSHVDDYRPPNDDDAPGLCYIYSLGYAAYGETKDEKAEPLDFEYISFQCVKE